VKVVAGLGNPGLQYRSTRHNIGFLVLDEFAARHEIPWKDSRFKGRISRGMVMGQEVMLVKPKGYMNRSGEGIAPLMAWVSTGPQDLIVVHDDIDLPFGRIRIRQSGGAGGHKGVLSIIGAIESEDFLRVRMGIGRPQQGEVTEYVLESFSKEENEYLPAFLDRGVHALECVLSEGADQAMNQFNPKVEMEMAWKGEKKTNG
jgi:PTH1 family peptidyl-tRNA hydrolase